MSLARRTHFIVNKGKTVLLVYVLRRCFAEKEPVIWHDGKDEDGVYQMAPDFQLNHFRTFVWTLVDSDAGWHPTTSRMESHSSFRCLFYFSDPEALGTPT